MEEPKYVLSYPQRIRTHATLGSTAGWFVPEHALAQRRPDAVGCICGIVAGHGGDVYWVAHEGSKGRVPYGWQEFELEPMPDAPCSACEGSGIDFPTSAKTGVGTACSLCGGSGNHRNALAPDYEATKDTIRALTPPQRACLDALCCGLNTWHRPRTLAKLVALGLAREYQERPSPDVPLRRYAVPPNVHVAWAEVCAAEEED